MPKLIAILAVLSMAMSIGKVDSVAANELSVHGSTTVADTILRPSETKIEHRSGESLTIVPNGSGTGIRDLISGSADVAMIAAPLEVIVAALNRERPWSVDGSVLIPHNIGTGWVAFIVNPSNPVESLTNEQLKEILAGRITNWSEVGGRNKPIVVIAGPRGSGIRLEVERVLLRGSEIPENIVQATEQPGDVVDAVGNDRNALGIAQEHGLHDSIVQLETDRPIQTALTLVTIGAASEQVSKVIEAARMSVFDQ